MINVDGKFFKSVKYLLIKPGYLAKAYINGKRNSFNDPVRIYLVTSFIFFIITGFVFNQLKKEIDKKIPLMDIENIVNDTTKKESGVHFNTNQGSGVSFNLNNDGDTLNVKQKTADVAGQIKNMLDETSSKLPYILWLTLPVFALVLKVFYLRRKIFYWDHIIFSLGIYSYSFLLCSFSFFLYYFLRWAIDLHENSIFTKILVWFSFGSMLTYMFISMKNFYAQGYFKTGLKLFLFSIVISILFMLEIAGFIYLLSTFN